MVNINFIYTVWYLSKQGTTQSAASHSEQQKEVSFLTFFFEHTTHRFEICFPFCGLGNRDGNYLATNLTGLSPSSPLLFDVLGASLKYFSTICLTNVK
jgi:hypothetical protein